ncbi:unnamed protein product [Spirodela intermedia]|uniref:Uncharacterized protein n=1 Tax=Spirodela intermedia TaxID=51605 RepID=A0A7I8KWX8_SPIIN|nr:unnamed protein product [Spirodela intermedia]
MVPPAQVTPLPPPPPPPSSRLGDPLIRRNTVSATSTRASCGGKKGTVKGPMKALGTGRRRPQRKDRHSKIFTARGPRDRRMRLSLDVARKFFDLQDMLGFDKASKTVDWLLTNATSSIKELVSCSPPPHAAGKSESSTSECEVISTSTPLLPVAAVENITLQPAKVVPLRRSRKGATHPMLSRESRVLARARARERTREKLGRKGAEVVGQRKLLAEEEIGGGQSGKSSLELMAEEGDGQPSSRSTEQHHKDSGGSPPLVIPSASGPVSVFDYNQTIISEAIGLVQEHWSMQSSGNVEEQRVLLSDAQLMPWFWDPYSNPSI